MTDEMDMMWTDEAREELVRQAETAAAALRAHAESLRQVAGEDDFDVAQAMAEAAELRRALMAYDDAAFDLTGSFPICLMDEDDEDDVEGDSLAGLPVGAEQPSAGGDEMPAHSDFVSLVVRTDLVVVDPQELADAISASGGIPGDDLADNIDTVVADLLANELVQVPGLKELRKAVVPILLSELEDDDSFAEDPLAVLVDDEDETDEDED